mgnify:CR=1 FL=1
MRRLAAQVTGAGSPTTRSPNPPLPVSSCPTSSPGWRSLCVCTHTHVHVHMCVTHVCTARKTRRAAVGTHPVRRRDGALVCQGM